MPPFVQHSKRTAAAVTMIVAATAAGAGGASSLPLLRLLVLALAFAGVAAFIPPATPAPNGNGASAAGQPQQLQTPRTGPSVVGRPDLVAPAELVKMQASAAKADAPATGASGSSSAGDVEAQHAMTLKAMQKFAEKYCEITDTYFCSDLEIAATVVKGLAKHKDELGAPLCPCRHYEDKAAEVSLAYWNCPCVPMRERKECHCMLFLTPESPFVGKEQTLPDEVLQDESVQGVL